MWQYGSQSCAKLETCHPALQRIADEALALSPYDITIVHGWRGEDIQNALYDSGASRKRWPNSRHNRTNDPAALTPNRMSDALDFAPYVNGAVPWNDTHIFAVVAGVFIAAANQLGYRLRWGGDFDNDGSTKDQTLMDYGHLEMVW